MCCLFFFNQVLDFACCCWKLEEGAVCIVHYSLDGMSSLNLLDLEESRQRKVQVLFLTAFNRTVDIKTNEALCSLRLLLS